MRYYLDCEFDGFGGPLMSLALVREDGQGVNYVFPMAVADPWVAANVSHISTRRRLAAKRGNAEPQPWTLRGS